MYVCYWPLADCLSGLIGSSYFGDDEKANYAGRGGLGPIPNSAGAFCFSGATCRRRSRSYRSFARAASISLSNRRTTPQSITSTPSTRAIQKSPCCWILIRASSGVPETPVEMPSVRVRRPVAFDPIQKGRKAHACLDRVRAGDGCIVKLGDDLEAAPLGEPLDGVATVRAITATRRCDLLIGSRRGRNSGKICKPRIFSRSDPVLSLSQSPAMAPGVTPVILPAASKPNNRLVASPRGKTNFRTVKV